MADVLSMHLAFLEEIAAKRERMTRELEEIRQVEEYHRRIVESAKTRSGLQSNGTFMGSPSALISDTRLEDASRHEACRIALEALGGEGKTQQVADWLKARGVGTEFNNPRDFYNTCYTALARRTDMFQKTGRGEWKLVR